MNASTNTTNSVYQLGELNWSENYYASVRDTIELRCECGTSDAQGIIDAFHLRDKDAGQWEAWGMTVDLAAELILTQ